MQLTERHLIKPNHELYATLDDLTFKAKNLYNHGLFLYRQSYFEHKKNPEAPVLTWAEIDKSLRKQGHDDIRAIPSKVAGAVLKNLGENISSFWKLVRLKNKGGLAQKPKLPNYLHKTDGRYVVSFNYQTFGAKRGFNNELFLCPKGINLPIPTKVANPQQVRIVPNHNNFVIEVIYNVEESALKSTSKYAGIDLGVDNFATVTFSTQNNPLIIKGLELKSINQGYNRLIAKAQSLLPGTCKTSKSIHRLWTRRSWILTTKIHQMTAFLATLFDEMQIEKVFIGKNNNWKQNLPFGKKVKQCFAYLPEEDEETIYNIITGATVYTETNDPDIKNLQKSLSEMRVAAGKIAINLNELKVASALHAKAADEAKAEIRGTKEDLSSPAVRALSAKHLKHLSALEIVNDGISNITERLDKALGNIGDIEVQILQMQSYKQLKELTIKTADSVRALDGLCPTDYSGKKVGMSSVDRERAAIDGLAEALQGDDSNTKAYQELDNLMLDKHTKEILGKS